MANGSVTQGSALEKTASTLGSSFSRGLILVLSVRAAETVVDQAGQGLRFLWSKFGGSGTSSLVPKRKKPKRKSEVSSRPNASA